jgi:dTMP kinase
MTQGCFITFEGVDGCGKSTQTHRFLKKLEHDGCRTVATREPGGTEIAEKIRSLVIDPANTAMSDECELLLYLAARAQHVREKIVPELEKGSVVVCDRFQDATFAYQGYGRDLPLDLLMQLNSFATGGIIPDLTFIFDISIEQAFKRLSAMNKPKDRLESGGKTFFERVRNGYRALAVAHPERIKLFDGSLSPGVLAGKVYSVYSEKMAGRSFLR